MLTCDDSVFSGHHSNHQTSCILQNGSVLVYRAHPGLQTFACVLLQHIPLRSMCFRSTSGKRQQALQYCVSAAVSRFGRPCLSAARRTIQPDSSMIQALVECDSTGQAYLRQIHQLKAGTQIRQTIHLEGGRLTATAAIDSMSIYLTYKDRYQTTEITRTETNTVTVTANILKSWQKLLMFIGALALIITAIRLYLKLRL